MRKAAREAASWEAVWDGQRGRVNTGIRGLGPGCQNTRLGGGGQEEPLLESRGQQEPTCANTTGLS